MGKKHLKRKFSRLPLLPTLAPWTETWSQQNIYYTKIEELICLQVENSSEGGETLSVVDTVLKMQEAATARQSVADITATGAALYDLLGQEPELRELRQSRAARPLEITQVRGRTKKFENGFWRKKLTVFQSTSTLTRMFPEIQQKEPYLICVSDSCERSKQRYAKQ